MSDKGTHSYSNRHRMHEANDTPISATPMSATPRTDKAEEQFWLNKCIEEGDVLTLRAVHSDFARQLELEINQLEWEIRKLKTEDNQIRKDADELILLNQAITMLDGSPRSDEMDTLVKDGKRLDWVLSDAGGFWLSSREDIDKEMSDIPGADETDALIKAARDDGYNQGFREGLAFKGKP